MAHQRYTSLKKAWRWFVVIVSIVLASYLGFVSVVFVWIGLTHPNQSGFWVPVLAGIISLIGILYFSFRIIRRILSQMKEKDLLNI